jgi:glutamate-1-semialdehyde 2,1-aminomutase
MQPSARYVHSEAQLARALKSIPLGAQTFSKSITQFPHGVSPYFAARAKGSRIWDVDGNEYVDFVNALAAVTLGYGDPDVNAAVAAQLADGTIFSLSHALEAEVAELICAVVPSAEMVRFGKNGSDATAGAIRIARAYTGRDHVLTCGYHGWQDWCIGATTRNKGVPEATRALTHTFPYNGLAAVDAKLAELDGKVAAIILEPMNVTAPAPGFLEGLKARAAKAGAMLIFDETITGFRYANGGAQELFGVTPDLTTLGKGIANGFPLSAVCGRRDIMMEMEEVFFSFTMGGETLSLAAAKAAIGKLLREPVVATLRQRGAAVVKGADELIARHGCGGFLSTAGDPTWSFLLMKDADGVSSFEIKTLFMQETLARGIISLGTHNMSYAHSPADVARLHAVYDEVFPLLRDAVANRAMRQYLKCEPLTPLFKVR